MATLDLVQVYTPEGYNADYSTLLRHLNAVNGLLKGSESCGVVRPTEDALECTRRLYAAVGRPLDRIKTVHVGGTNGKGTTSYKIARALTSQGIRTGLFVSPHISSFRERFQVDHDIVSEADFVRLVPKVLETCAREAIPASMFEIVFVAFACVCEDSGCEAAVLEVGLGGTLDATNVVQTSLSIICSVSLDHTRILGSTVEEIATVKSGIFKKGVPCLVGKYTPTELLKRKADEIGAPYHYVEDVVGVNHLAEEEAGVPVDAAKDCTSIAIAALSLLQQQGGCFDRVVERSDVFAAALETRPPCRWEVLSKRINNASVEIVMDVGHNPAAVTALAKRIRRDYPPDEAHVFVVYAASRGKDVGACLRAIGAASDHPERVFFAQCTYFRAIKVEDLRCTFEEEVMAPCGVVVNADGEVSRSVAEVLRHALESAAAATTTDAGKKGVVVVCGSLYMMSVARQVLGFQEARDEQVLGST